ncbi:site-specific DNA-methyltransferase [Tumebacillus flagellatus]|uniref:DNA methyltransferase n=1 Tax=Tumebacillus flagellatus TaxID=1157490 RepID=A0A074LRH9_9BACL|nr:site-specific DNA-methyltransferase [Tumebacillus flagellatus]KEO82443.1 DNA methyltransferase [Tumebacillus flagellatus]
MNPSVDLEKLERDDLLNIVRDFLNSNGIALQFSGKRMIQQIQKKVRPRVTRVVRELCVGPEDQQARNLLIEGENLQAMVTLYKYRGQVDLIVTDPPYNTGQFFRYNDRWDEDPNDPDLGDIVSLEDGSRHTKWMKAMMPRLNMMKAMLKPNGVIAVCIDDNELFHLGMMMDEVFGEQNRIAIINWQKSYAPKNDSKHVSSATEYVLVYARDKEQAKTGLLSRDEAMNAKYKNPDQDPEGPWKTNGDPTVATPAAKDRYAIQSPFTGALHYPGARAWSNPKKKMKEWLEAWGSSYVERDLGDGRPKALVLKNAPVPRVPSDQNLDNNPVVEATEQLEDTVLAAARQAAEAIRDHEVWPMLYFSSNGQGRPAIKRYLKHVKQGKIPLTYWADEEYEDPEALGVQSWDHEESGHSQIGINELDTILGKGHQFQTVKPLKLMKKIIQLWCPPNGLVLDPYAGSGTTAHAVLELNYETGSDRRFILIEQGSPEQGDAYARSLTHERVRRAITGQRPSSNGSLEATALPLPGGFEFRQLLNRIDAAAVLSMKKDELVDVVITSHWESERRNSSNLIRLDAEGYRYLIGKNDMGEGYFLIWEEHGAVGQLDMETYAVIHEEARRAGLHPPFHVYARYEIFQSRSVRFYKIPDKILSHLGLNEHSDPFHEEEEGV